MFMSISEFRGGKGGGVLVLYEDVLPVSIMSPVYSSLCRYIKALVVINGDVKI